MLKYKIRWCEWCDKSIPKGELYGKNKEQDICLECRGKKRRRRNWIAGALVALSLAVGLTSAVIVDNRIDDNSKLAYKAFNGMRQNRAVLIVLIQSTDDVIHKLNDKINTVSAKLNAATVGEEGYLALLQKIRKEMAEVGKQQEEAKKALADLNAKADLTDLVKIKKAVERNVEALRARLDILDRDPAVIMEKIIKPTVSIAVKDKKGEKITGSGVLYRKEKLANGKYRYTGFTAYHVWRGVLKYYWDIKQPDAKPIIMPDGELLLPIKMDKTLAPKMSIRTYAGTYSVTRYFDKVNVVWPDKHMGKLNGRRDVLVFQFETTVDMPVADMASDEEVRAVRVGDRILVTGIAYVGSVSLYTGTVANLNLGSKSSNSTLFHAYAYFGNSGGPIYHARTLKIISMTQRVGTAPILGGLPGGYALEDLLIGHRIDEIRDTWRAIAPKKHKTLLDATKPKK